MFGLIKKIFGHKEDPDLNSLNGIRAIKIPDYAHMERPEYPDILIEYKLQRKATEHKKNGRMDLAIECLRKSNEIFPHSPFSWLEKDYMRLPEYLKQAGRFDEARQEERKIREIIASLRKEFPRLIGWESGRNYTDLAISDNYSYVCEECAKYRRRVFSLSGKDKRFPEIPEYLKTYSEKHQYCQISFWLYFLGSSYIDWDYGRDIIAYSNRPYIDDRTDEEIENFHAYVAEKEGIKIDKKEFDYLREFYSDVAPKSFRGYRKMKATQSERYKKLVPLLSDYIHGTNAS